ncbi:MAG: hypothetical protein WCA09_06815 [Burkholderiales bacterium]
MGEILMLQWSVEVREGGRRAAHFELPSNIERHAVVELLRLLTVKGLSFREIVECVWSKPHARAGVLDAEVQDEGRTLTCGNDVVKVYARQKWKPTEQGGQT